MPEINKKHKDRLFKFIFGNPEHKEWTLSLYNALNGSNHTDPEKITFNTIDDAIYLGMQNDVSFILLPVMSFWEHQSTFNPNLPVRFLIYAGSAYDGYLTEKNIYRYGTVLHKLPIPKCICFYNGTDERPEKEVLRLSDAFDADEPKPDIEVSVLMLNINYGHNSELMEQCKSLYEYAYTIDAIRNGQKIMNNINAAVDAALDGLPDDFELKRFLLAHRAEVKGMYLTEYDEEKERRLAREEAARIGHDEGLAAGLAAGRAEGLAAGRSEGLVAGRAEGLHEANERVASDMLREKFPIDMIEKISKLSEDAIRKLAQSLGITVA